MSEVKHTPLPWRVVTGNDPSDFVVEDSTHNTVCETNIALYTDASELDPGVRKISLEEAMGNAILIVTACNSHQELVEALKAFVDGGECGCNPNYLQNNLEPYTCRYCKARTALAKAGRP